MADNFQNPGNLPFNYQVVSESIAESFDNNGQRASITFLGPWENRLDFLDILFGRWVRDPDEDCCVSAVDSTPPSLYPGPLSLVEFEELEEGEPVTVTGVVHGGLGCLYPDSYTLRQYGDPTPDPDAFSIIFQGGNWIRDGYELNPDKLFQMNNPIRGCSAEITVDYVSKATAINADYALCNCGNFAPIAIPPGVFVDYTYTTDIEFVTVPGRDFSYDETYYSDASVILTPAEPCRSVDGMGGFNDLEQVPDEVDNAIPVYSGSINMKLSNMPVPYTHEMLNANNRINSVPILGFPAGSLLMQMGQPRARMNHRCEFVYDVEIQFLIRMVDFCTNNDDGDFDDLHLAMGIVCDKMGVWNKRWRRCPIELNTAEAPSCCTHWQEIATSVECEGVQKAFKTTDFTNMIDIYCQV